MNTIRKTLVIAGYGLLLLSCGALAQPTIPITIDTFHSGGDIPGPGDHSAWDVRGVDLGMDISYVNAEPLGDVLQISLAGLGGAGGFGAVGTVDGDFLGDYTGLIVKFQLTGGENLAPEGLALYFNSASAGTWLLGLTPGRDTQYYTVQMDGQGLWDGGGDFLDAIKNITQIGIRLVGASEGPYTYYLDNFEVAVPEPETVWMMLAVVVSLGVTFRSRLAELAGQVKARFVKA